MDHFAAELSEEDRGLRYDLPRLLSRRRALMLGGAAIGLLAACSEADAPRSPSGDPTRSSTGEGRVGEVPDETAGPFPGDGSNGRNVLDDTGVVRSDIRSSLEGGVTTDGVPLTFRISARYSATGAALAGAGIYVWHCDREGRYSMYSRGAEDRTFLRGVQETGAAGTAEFVSVFPGCYPGRWPHVHFEVYRSLAAAVGQDGDDPILKTSQLAFPVDACETAYAADGYARSAETLGRLSLDTDAVFADDGGIRQLATVTGDADRGFTAELTIGV